MKSNNIMKNFQRFLTCEDFDMRLGCSNFSRGNAIRAARHIIDVILLHEIDGMHICSVFSTQSDLTREPSQCNTRNTDDLLSNLYGWISLTTSLHCQMNQRSHCVEVQGYEGVTSNDVFLDIEWLRNAIGKQTSKFLEILTINRIVSSLDNPNVS